MTTTSLPPDYHPDYIIVGGGAAGCIVAARLAEYLPKKKILLIEAGPSDFEDDRFRVMRRWFELVGSEFDYDYKIEEQTFGNSTIRHSRAKVLGGCSSHNTSLAFRPFDRDLAEWQSYGALGWDSKTIGRCLDQLRIQYQPIPQADRNNLFKDCVAACSSALNLPVIEDFNATIREKGDISSGVGFFSVAYNPEDGKRSNASSAYIHPVLEERKIDESAKPHLTILVEAWCSHIQLSADKTVESVTVKLKDEEEPRIVKAKQEVILCAGAIDTPRLLLLSGLGPEKQLKDLGITVQHNIPGVGENLQDHPEATITWELNQPMPKKTATDNDIGIFLDRHLDGVADIMIHTTQEPFKVTYEPYTLRPGFPPPEYTFCMAPNMPRPRSRGRLWLDPENPTGPPKIDPRYFTDPYDSQALVDGLRFARKVAEEEPFKKWLKCELAPGPTYQTDRDLWKYGRKYSRTVYHPCGTTKMGNIEIDPMAVVDPTLKVRGVKGLRIADAGIFPTLTTINPMLTVYAVGERCAELIVQDNGWRPEDIPVIVAAGSSLEPGDTGPGAPRNA